MIMHQPIRTAAAPGRTTTRDNCCKVAPQRRRYQSRRRPRMATSGDGLHRTVRLVRVCTWVCTPAGHEALNRGPRPETLLDSRENAPMGDPGLEPGTSSLSEKRSNRLS
jgi:hypothetical protein